MLHECLTVDGHYAEVETGGTFEIEDKFYQKGVIYSKEFPDGVVTFWNSNFNHANEKLSIVRFRVGPEDREFQIRKEQALEYRKVTNEPR